MSATPMMQRTQKGVTPGDLYRNLVLENVSIAAFQDPSQFIARAVFPTIGAVEEVGKYYVLDMNTVSQDKMKVRAPGTEAEEGVWNMTLASFTCEQWAYKEKLPEELLATGGPAGNAETAAAGSVAEVGLINEELRWGSAFWTTGVWGRDMAGAASFVANTSYIYWSTLSTSTPILDVAAESNLLLLKCRRRPNTMILGADVLPQLINHPTIIARVNAGQTPGSGASGVAMASMPYEEQLRVLAMCFGVQRVLVASGVYNATKEGSNTAVPTFCLSPKSAWLGYVNPKPSIFSPSAGYRFTWKTIAGNDQGIRNWRYWDQAKRSWYVELAINDTFAKVQAAAGMFFNGIVQ